MLEFDTVIRGAHKRLISLSLGNCLILCTARSNAQSLNEQLVKLGIFDLFSDILQVQLGSSKAELLSRYYETSPVSRGSQAWMIGDTSEDIQAGISVGLKTCGVLSGLATRAIFKEAGASQICDSLTYFQPEN